MSEIDIMKFKHWLSNPDADVNWTTVAQQQKYKNDSLEFDFFTTSALAETDSPTHLLEEHKWLVILEFGNPGIWEYDNGVRYDENSSEELENIRLEPFVFYRSWHGKSIPAKFELIQDFILFYNLRFDAKENIFKAASETGEDINVVRIQDDQNNKKIEINTTFLRNYLTFKNRILVRQHCHSIRNIKTLEELGIDSSRYYLKNDNCHFAFVIDEHDSLSAFKAYGNTLGKDLVLPFDKRKHLLGWSKEYCKFIIGVDEQGEKIEFTCEEEKLGNFSGKGGQFLSPVFFKREVLKKYHDAPSKYTVKPTIMTCGGIWSIPIDTNYVDLVQVYLGDLGHIPYEEQQHWRLFNVVPEGGITRSRFTRDVEAGFADPEDVVFRFTKALSILQERFESKFGFKPFKPLDSNDYFIESNIRIPLSNEITEFETQIGYLAKLLPDSINVKEIRKKLEADNFDSQKLDEIKDKKIRMLESFLNHEFLDHKIILELDTIQNIRSSGVSHRKGSGYEKTISKYGLDKISYIEFFKNLMEKLVQSIDDINW